MKYKEIGLSWNSGEFDLCIVLSKDLFYLLTIECVGFDGSFDDDSLHCNGFSQDNKVCTNAKECCKDTLSRHSCFNISLLKGKYIIRRAIKCFTKFIKMYVGKVRKSRRFDQGASSSSFV